MYFEFVYLFQENGQVYSWGDNEYGQLGIGSTTQENSPVLISSLSNVKQISASNNFGHSLALLSMTLFLV